MSESNYVTAMPLIISAIEQDKKNSDYFEFVVYWKHRRNFWSKVLSRKMFENVDKVLWKEIDNFQRM